MEEIVRRRDETRAKLMKIQPDSAVAAAANDSKAKDGH